MKRTVDNMLLDGGCPCFNFTNTIHSRKDEVTYDYLNSYNDVIGFAERVKLISHERLKKLRKIADENEEKAKQKLNEIKNKRELLYKIFSAIINNKTVDEQASEDFNKVLGNSLSNLRFRFNKGKVTLSWKENEVDLMEPLWIIFKDAFDILTLKPLERVKECKACGWLFLDKSKNNSRTWCNMQSCGSIIKAKRYYYKKKVKTNN